MRPASLRRTSSVHSQWERPDSTTRLLSSTRPPSLHANRAATLWPQAYGWTALRMAAYNGKKVRARSLTLSHEPTCGVRGR